MSAQNRAGPDLDYTLFRGSNPMGSDLKDFLPSSRRGLSLPPRSLQPGQYVLRLVVTDRVTATEIVTYVMFTASSPAASVHSPDIIGVRQYLCCV